MYQLIFEDFQYFEMCNILIGIGTNYIYFYKSHVSLYVPKSLTLYS